MKVLTGYSVEADPFKAGQEAGKKAGKCKNAKVVFANMSCEYDVAKVVDGLRSVYSCPIIGNTSFTGVIMPEGYIGGDKPFVGIMVLSDPDLVVGTGFVDRKKYKDPRKAGVVATKQALESFEGITPNLMYMAASPAEEEFYLKGAFDVIGRVPCFGGSAADNTIEGNWKLYLDGKNTADGAAIALFHLKQKFANEFTGAYRETKDMGIITKIAGNRTLVEIDGVPAVKKYACWRKMKPKAFSDNKLLAETILSPLGVKDRLGDLTAIRHPMFANKDLSMNIGANLAVGTCVVRMEATVEELIKSVGNALKTLNKKLGVPAACYHIVHCGGRRAGIGDKIDLVYKEIKKQVGDVPFICEFTFGEYGYVDDGNNTTGGLMLSFTAIAK